MRWILPVLFNEEEQYHAGTINTWVLINGKLSDEALFQAMISTTEAKVKALVDEGVTDPTTGTLATGTSTDSLLIASTEEGTSINMQVPSLCLVRSLAMVFMKRCVRRLGNTKR